MAPLKRVLVNGAAGFIGMNLCEALSRRPDVHVEAADVADWNTERGRVKDLLHTSDVIYHLAGVNRPARGEDFEENVRCTSELCESLEVLGRAPTIVFSSSIQAALENPYGVSKRRAEEVLCDFSSRTGARAIVYRLPGVFGKWCRPSYNSVVATFCHNIARGLPITISDPANRVALVYVDDVVGAFLRHLDGDKRRGISGDERASHEQVEPSFETTLEDLVARLSAFRDERRTDLVPDLSDPFTRRLYATYKSYLPSDHFAYALEQRRDPRGALAEFVKSPHAGQIFVSRTKPGITRGNHFHHTKVEKFFVVEGQAIIRFRDIRGTEVLECPVSGEEFRVVDIPPGYTHSIENVGTTELVVLFWADEIFDPAVADTYPCEVKDEQT